MISTITKLPTGRLRIDETSLCGWIGQAAPGDVLEYYRGFLAPDTFSHGTRLVERERAELVRVARRAWWRGFVAGWRTDPGQRRVMRWSTVVALSRAGRPPVV